MCVCACVCVCVCVHVHGDTSLLICIQLVHTHSGIRDSTTPTPGGQRQIRW